MTGQEGFVTCLNIWTFAAVAKTRFRLDLKKTLLGEIL